MRHTHECPRCRESWHCYADLCLKPTAAVCHGCTPGRVSGGPQQYTRLVSSIYRMGRE